MVVHTRLEAKIIYEYGERCKSESRVSVTVTTQVCEGWGGFEFLCAICGTDFVSVIQRLGVRQVMSGVR